MAGGAVLLTIAGLYAVTVERTMSELRDRERAREAVALAAESLRLNLQRLSAELVVPDSPGDGAWTLSSAARGEDGGLLTDFVLLSKNGEMLYPAARPPARPLPPSEREHVATFLEEAAWQEFTMQDPASAAVAFENAASEAREIEAARAKSEFIAGVTHELKTPLASIRLYSEMLSEGRVGDNAKQKEYVATIGREASRLTQLIDRVLTLAKLERPVDGASPVVARAGEILQIARDAFGPVAQSERLKFAVHANDADTVVAADPPFAGQAVLDLLDNARKYAASGGIVELYGERRGEHYVIEVADRGPGLPDGDPERLFVMFARGPGDSTSGQSGLGIGLALARRIVSSRGGTLEVRRRDGGGAVFTMTLQVVQSLPAEP